ncbi:hypothetical protein V6917_16585 [Pectobacterium brasiliense]|uniref:hypothetical protein n=1 Tax=Pectobacterium brasiliense TaxID=180957 RepID=UPI0030D3AF0B
MEITAYAWASGVIDFGCDVPEYASRILSGDREQVFKVINKIALTLPGSEKLVVSDMYCASSRRAAYQALSRFIKRANEAYKLQPVKERRKKWQIG